MSIGGDKFELYRSRPTFEEYVLMDFRRVKAEIWSKKQSRWY